MAGNKLGFGPSIFDIAAMQGGAPVPPVPFRPGYSPSQKVANIPAPPTGNSESVAAPIPPPPSTTRSATFSIPGMDDSQTDAIYQMFMERAQERAGGIEGMKKQMETLQGNEPSAFQKLDLRPLLTMMDPQQAAVANTFYKSPTAAKDHQEQLEKLRNASLKEEQQLSDDLAKLAQQKTYGRALMEQGRMARHEENKSLKKEDTIRKTLSKATDDFKARDQQFAMMETAISSGDVAMVKNMLSQIARNIGGEKGALSDGDVSRVFQSDIATDIGSLAQYISGQGQISPEMKARLYKLLNAAKFNASKYHRENLGRMKTGFSAGEYADLMAPGRAGAIIFDSHIQALPEPQAPGAPPQSAAPAGPAGGQGLSVQDMRAKLKGAGY